MGQPPRQWPIPFLKSQESAAISTRLARGATLSKDSLRSAFRLNHHPFKAADPRQNMGLLLRRTRIEQSPAFAHLGDWDVLDDDGRPVGRIYQKHAPAHPEYTWFWSITEYVEPRSGLRTNGMTETLDAAKAEFRDSYDKWRAWAAKTGYDSGAA